jgi:hypothetical protein
LNNVKEKENNAEPLENAIVAYQEALAAGESLAIEECYEKVIGIYDPLAFADTWLRRYRFLFDTAEDFAQEYLAIFCKALANWKPRHLRKASRYGGTGVFKNYFWGCLQHAYSNRIKSEASFKRNLAQRCPICEDWCGSLSLHVFETHQSLLFDKMRVIGYNLEELTSCPFCKSFKSIKKAVCSCLTACGCQAEANAFALRKHLVSNHSSLLFERFHELYQGSITVSAKPISATMHDDSTGEESFAYESMSKGPSLDSLYSLGLDELQMKLVEEALDGKELTWTEKLGCSEVQFAEAIDGLKDLMHIAGLEG